MKGWAVIIVKHVIPLNDNYGHEESRNCWCSPKTEDHERLIIHNAADKRERSEHLSLITITEQEK